MASANFYMLPLSVLIQYLTNIGVVAQGATITTQVAGSASTLQTTYSDSTGTVPNANPLTVNAAGRPANPVSGALVAFWVASGVTVDVYFTDTLGETWSIKNMSGINDPSGTNSLQTLLSSPANANVSGSGPVGGVDFVANAIKSYDVIIDVRAANAPVLASGQTLSIQVQGGFAIDDGLGGDFYWNATSTAADNGTTVLRPNSVALGSPGRWLRLYTPPYGPFSPIAAAPTTDLGSLATNNVQVTGSATITSFGVSASVVRPLYFVSFAASATLVQAPSLLCPGGQSIVTQAGDSCIAVYLGSTIWQIIAYFRAASNFDTVLLVKATDQTQASNTALANDNTLVNASLAAGASYLVQLRLQLVGAVAGMGYKVQLTTSVAIAGVSTGMGISSVALTASALQIALNAPLAAATVSTTTPDVVSLDFVIQTSTSAVLSLQWAQNSSNAGLLTMKAGSAMIVKRLS